MTGRFEITGWVDVADEFIEFQTSQIPSQTQNLKDSIRFMEGFEDISITMTPPSQPLIAQ